MAALVGGLLLAAPAANAGPVVGVSAVQVPAAAVFVSDLPPCAVGAVCDTGNGTCFTIDPKTGKPSPATCPDRGGDDDPQCRDAAGAPIECPGSGECYTRGGELTACDADDCGEGPCTKDCVDAATHRVPCDSNECTEGQDCTQICRDVAGAKIDCGDGQCVRGQCAKDCVDGKSTRVPCDSDQCTAGRDCDQNICTDTKAAVVDCGDATCTEGACIKACADSAGKQVPCESETCVTGADCAPPTTGGDDPGVGTTATIERLGNSNSLAETGVKVADLGYLALILLGAGAVLLGFDKLRDRRLARHTAE